MRHTTPEEELADAKAGAAYFAYEYFFGMHLGEYYQADKSYGRMEYQIHRTLDAAEVLLQPQVRKLKIDLLTGEIDRETYHLLHDELVLQIYDYLDALLPEAYHQHQYDVAMQELFRSEDALEAESDEELKDSIFYEHDALELESRMDTLMQTVDALEPEALGF